MILTGFMSKNTPNCKIKGARVHINNCIGRISFVLQKLGREGDLCVEPLAQKFASSSREILRLHWQPATRWLIPIRRIEPPNAHDALPLSQSPTTYRDVLARRESFEARASAGD